MTTIRLVFALALCLCSAAFANESTENALLWKYLDGLNPASIFYGSCRLSGEVKAFLVLPLLKPTGRLYVMGPNGLISSYAAVQYEKGHWSVFGVMQGGGNEQTAMLGIGRGLLEGSFRMVDKEKFRSIESETPVKNCRGF